MQSARSTPVLPESEQAIGPITAMVPQDVPIAVETKQETAKSTSAEKRAGINVKKRSATLAALFAPEFAE